MKEPVFRGAGVAIVTPMHPDGSINYECFGKLIDFQIGNGTDAIVVCGTTGECSTLSAQEHIDAIRFVVEKTAKRVPVIAGTGSNDTAFALHLCGEAQQAGADGLLMVTPYYNKTTQSGLIRHFEYIADRVDLPIILYNIPSRTGLSIKPETYRVLAKHPNINAVKEASGDFSAIAKTLSLCGDDLVLYSGNDDHILPMLALGGAGVISTVSNIVPRMVHDLCVKYFEGDPKAALSLQLRLVPLIAAVFSEVNPIPIKHALNLMGYDAGECRMPLAPMEEKNIAGLKKEMQKFGLLA